MKLKKFLKDYPSLYLWSKDNGHAIKSLSKNIPSDHINSISSISNVNLFVNKNVLIPRQETLELIDLAVKIIKEKNLNYSADIGTGSGFIGISILKAVDNTDFRIDLVDKSIKSLYITKKNLESENLSENAELIYSDLLEYLNEKHEKNPQIIISNLPYIPSKKIRTLPKNVRKFEPVIALDGGKDGTIYIKKLISQVWEKKIQYCVLEIYETHEIPLTKYLKRYPFKEYRFIKDSFNNTRFLQLTID